ncbi:hypothetical protein GC173_12425 [bacterium]|nr:hypothetical protein [bacterium]
MICQNCQKAEATIRITRISQGKPTDMNLCGECALELSPYHAKLAKKKQADLLSVENLLKEMLHEQGGAIEEVTEEVEAEGAVCPSCGLDFSAYKRTCMVGCADCYDSFGDLILRDIMKLHGATEHRGERVSTPPAPTMDMQARLRMMKDELEECVANEDFERAAVLRDEIRSLQEKMREEAP